MGWKPSLQSRMDTAHICVGCGRVLYDNTPFGSSHWLLQRVFVSLWGVWLRIKWAEVWVQIEKTNSSQSCKTKQGLFLSNTDCTCASCVHLTFCLWSLHPCNPTKSKYPPPYNHTCILSPHNVFSWWVRFVYFAPQIYLTQKRGLRGLLWLVMFVHSPLGPEWCCSRVVLEGNLFVNWYSSSLSSLSCQSKSQNRNPPNRNSLSLSSFVMGPTSTAN